MGKPTIQIQERPNGRDIIRIKMDDEREFAIYVGNSSLQINGDYTGNASLIIKPDANNSIFLEIGTVAK